jgi:nucleoside-diphosphate-sugar epimerase
VISSFIDAALDDLDITINGDGLQTRTFCYIEDNIQASINALMENLFVNDVVNIGNDKEVSILELAEMIVALTGSRSKIVHRPPLAEGDMTRRKPDVSNMKKLLRREFISLEDGLSRIISFKRNKSKKLIV